MLPISAIVGVSTVGYLLDQVFREAEFNENNEHNEIYSFVYLDLYLISIRFHQQLFVEK